jgi:Cu2+-exporting ATPase
METARTCHHCQLPVGTLGQRRDSRGQTHWFCCYGCCLAHQVRLGEREEPEAAAALIRLGVGAFLAMNIMLASLLLYTHAFTGEDDWLRQPAHWLLWALSTALVILLGRPFAQGAWQALRERRPSADLLVCVGVASAYLYSGWQVLRGGDLVFFDTISMVLLLFTLGRLLEANVRVRTARSLAPMLEAAQAQVRMVLGEQEILRPAAELRAGDLVRVLPGERIGIDGVVVAGASVCNEAALSGQDEPQLKTGGSLVFGGSVNGGGPLLLRATVDGADSHWMRVGAQVREALGRKSMAGDTVDRIATLFIPAVVVLAAASAWYWQRNTPGSDVAMLSALAVLVVACPCSLGLAAPLAHTLAIGRAAQRGILVRGGAVLERLAAVRGVAFDKTGTLTDEVLRPEGVHVHDASPETVLHRAGALASGSSHPIARAIAALAPDAAREVTYDMAATAGQGLLGRVDGVLAAVGSPAYLRWLGWDVPASLLQQAPRGATIVLVGWDGRATGLIALRALPLPDLPALLAALRRQRIATLLLSGDNAPAVARFAREIGVDDWRADLLPHQKVEALHDWRAHGKGPPHCGHVAMVGDGQNDGPVLAAAPVGIAVAGATDLARESADIVLSRAGLGALPWLIAEARAVRRSVLVNLGWAFGYNAVALSLAASGQLRPVVAAALMAGSSVIVALRSWRSGGAAGGRADTSGEAPDRLPPLPARRQA